jgi:REP element-mobilizing transposase RayT
VYRVVREATLTTARREDFRIVHLSIQRTHIHLLVEANDKRALAAGLQGFQISAAKHLNAAISKGKANNWRNLVAPGGLEALWLDLVSRGAVGETVTGRALRRHGWLPTARRVRW